MGNSSFPSPQHAPPFPGPSSSSIPIYGHSFTEGEVHLETENESNRSRVAIDMLPDTIFLEVFGFYMDGNQIEAWHTLVHVCRNWRFVVFGSPRRLNLRLFCTARMPVRALLDVWPLLPIVVQVFDFKNRGVDNIIAALEHNDRICELDLYQLPRSQMEKVLPAMQKPFPLLTHLYIRQVALIDPELFLGGSAPRLRTLILHEFPFPGLPNLLLSATHLVYLDLWFIPHISVISANTMITYLSVLTRLEILEIGFESPQSLPDQRSRDLPFTRILLPVLTKLRYQGPSEYLEDLVARVDAPLLDNFLVTFLHQLISNTPQLSQFISRTPKFKPRDEALLALHPEYDVWVTLPQTFGRKLRLDIACNPSDQLLSLARVCSSSVPRVLISAVERLYIVEGALHVRIEGDIEYNPAQWLELLHPFTAVKGLFISTGFTPHLAHALQELVGERVTEVLPTLQTLFLETPPKGTVKEAIGQFVAARQLIGQCVALSHWNGKKDIWDEMEG